MASTFTYVSLALLFASIIISPIGCNAEKSKQMKHQNKLLFVFGDSLFDLGNNQYLNTATKGKGPKTSWPYGMNLHNRSTRRLSDGLLVPDFIALFMKLPPLPPCLKPGANFTYRANFASAGGKVLGGSSQVMNLDAQLSNFKKVVSTMVQKVGEEETKKILKRSVYLFSLGGNDYFSFSTNYPNATETQRKEHIQMVIGNLTLGIKELYGIGLRKLAFQNVGPLGCYATVKAMNPDVKTTCLTWFLTNPEEHNKALSIALKNLQTELQGFHYGIFDYYNALKERLINPKKYGFKVGQTACCGSGSYNGKRCGTEPFNFCSNPSEYVLFDGAHHTQRTNYQLAQLLWNGAPYVTGPHTATQLFELP